VADPDDWVQYEVQVATGFVDAYIGRTKVLILPPTVSVPRQPLFWEVDR